MTVSRIDRRTPRATALAAAADPVPLAVERAARRHVGGRRRSRSRGRCSTNRAGTENLAHAGDAPWIFIVARSRCSSASCSPSSPTAALDAKAVAVLGVLVACGAALRAPTTGVTGFTGIFFLLIPGGRVFGRGFGFVQGALTMFASALLTGGVGPWLPFQMLCAAWVGFFAGCLPPHDRDARDRDARRSTARSRASCTGS